MVVQTLSDLLFFCIFSVREWIQCMQVCCHSRTTHSISPPAAAMATPSNILPVHAHSGHTHLPCHASLAALANPTTFAYHLAPSTLAYLPVTSDLSSHAHPSAAVSIDTGYVSGEPSPTEHAQMVSVARWLSLCYVYDSHTFFQFDMKTPTLRDFSTGYKHQSLTTPIRLHPSQYSFIAAPPLHPHDTMSYWMLSLPHHYGHT